MDESHNAGGEGSNVSNYLQYITTRAKGLTFLSATFAKRPGNMPIYSLKTAIAKAGVKVDELIEAVKRGGATFQEIMSKALTEAGFADMENDLWVRAVTPEEYRNIIEDFKKQTKETDEKQLKQSHIDNEESIKLNIRLHSENERMASRRAKLRVLKFKFEGASLFSVVISVMLVFVSVLYRSDKDMKTIALPLWASLTLLPVIIAGAVIAAIKKMPELYLAAAVLTAACALIAWDAASIMLAIVCAAFAAFYLMTRSINLMKPEPEYPNYFDKKAEDIR
jgi:hypothetical protein